MYGNRGYSTYLRNDLCELENNVRNDRRNEFDKIINSKYDRFRLQKYYNQNDILLGLLLPNFPTSDLLL